MECHSIKELDPKLIGKRWAALRATNVSALGIHTYADFMQAQVRPHALLSWPSRSRCRVFVVTHALLTRCCFLAPSLRAGQGRLRCRDSVVTHALLPAAKPRVLHQGRGI